MSLLVRCHRLLPSHSVSRGSAILTLGAIASQALALAAAPALTRLYTPEEFGLYAVFMGLLGIIGGVASLRYQCAVPLPKTDDEAAPLIPLGLGIIAIIGGLCLAVDFTFGQKIAALLGTPALAQYLWLLSLSIVLVGVYELLHYWALRRHAYAVLAKTNVTRAATLLAVQMGGAGFGAIALLAGSTVSQFVGVISLFWRVGREGVPLFVAVQSADILRAATRYRKFPIFDTSYSLLAVLATQMPALLLAGLFGPTVAGVFTLTQRVLAAPMALIGDAVAGAFFAAGAECHRRGVLGDEVIRLHTIMSQLAAPVTLAVVFAGPNVFAIVFGEAWRTSGEFAQWMALALYAQLVTAPLTSVFYVLERQATAITLQIVNVVLRASSLVVGAWFGDPLLAIALFAVSGAFSYALMLVWVVSATTARLSVILTGGLSAAIWGLGLTMPLAAATVLRTNQLYFLVACGATAALIGMRYFRLAGYR